MAGNRLASLDADTPAAIFSWGPLPGYAGDLIAAIELAGRTFELENAGMPYRVLIDMTLIDGRRHLTITARGST